MKTGSKIPSNTGDINMKTNVKNKKHIGIAVLISVIVLTVISAAVSAVYINQNIVKKVVSTKGAGGTPFSSNYLLLVPKETASFAMKTIYCSEGADSAQFVINVCNYVQNDPSNVNENDISYTLTLTLMNSDGSVYSGDTEGLSVTDNDGSAHSFSSGVCTISGQLLEKNQRSVNTYTIIVPKQMVRAVQMSAVAEPSDSSSYSAANGNKLGRTFTFAEYNASATTWTGGFSETDADGYDAFNYIIRGQGKGTVTLTWDASQLEINKIFLDSNGLQGNVTSNGNMKSLSFEVDSTDGQNRYDIQFYKTDNGVYTDMETINRYVTVDFSEADSQ